MTGQRCIERNADGLQCELDESTGAHLSYYPEGPGLVHRAGDVSWNVLAGGPVLSYERAFAAGMALGLEAMQKRDGKDLSAEIAEEWRRVTAE